MPIPIKIVNQSWTCLKLKQILFKYMLSPTFLELPSHLDMHLITCSEKALCCMLSVLLNGFLLSCWIKLQKEMYWPHPWCSIYHLYSCHEVRLWASKQMVPQSVLVVCIFLAFIQMELCDNICYSHVSEGNPRWRYKDVLQVQHCSTISLGGVHLFNIHLHSIVCPHRLMTMFKGLNPDRDVLQVQHHSHLLLEFTRSWLFFNNIAPDVIWMCSFIDYFSSNHIVLRSPILHLIFFLCPPADMNTVCFPSQGPLYCPNVTQLFKECWEELMSFHVKDFTNSIDVLLCSTIFLVLESNLIFQRSCLLKSNCWNEMREVSVLEKIFWKSSFLVKDPTHVIQNM